MEGGYNPYGNGMVVWRTSIIQNNLGVTTLIAYTVVPITNNGPTAGNARYISGNVMASTENSSANSVTNVIWWINNDPTLIATIPTEVSGGSTATFNNLTPLLGVLAVPTSTLSDRTIIVNTLEGQEIDPNNFTFYNNAYLHLAYAVFSGTTILNFVINLTVMENLPVSIGGIVSITGVVATAVTNTPLDVNITTSSLNVNVTNSTLTTNGTAVVSGNVNANVTNNPLNVNVTGTTGSENVVISDVNIKNQTTPIQTTVIGQQGDNLPKYLRGHKLNQNDKCARCWYGDCCHEVDVSSYHLTEVTCNKIRNYKLIEGVFNQYGNEMLDALTSYAQKRQENPYYNYFITLQEMEPNFNCELEIYSDEENEKKSIIQSPTEILNGTISAKRSQGSYTGYVKSKNAKKDDKKVDNTEALAEMKGDVKADLSYEDRKRNFISMAKRIADEMKTPKDMMEMFMNIIRKKKLYSASLLVEIFKQKNMDAFSKIFYEMVLIADVVSVVLALIIQYMEVNKIHQNYDEILNYQDKVTKMGAVKFSFNPNDLLATTIVPFLPFSKFKEGGFNPWGNGQTDIQPQDELHWEARSGAPVGDEWGVVLPSASTDLVIQSQAPNPVEDIHIVDMNNKGQLERYIINTIMDENPNIKERHEIDKFINSINGPPSTIEKFITYIANGLGLKEWTNYLGPGYIGGDFLPITSLKHLVDRLSVPPMSEEDKIYRMHDLLNAITINPNKYKDSDRIMIDSIDKIKNPSIQALIAKEALKTYGRHAHK